MSDQDAKHQAAADHQRVVRASARVLAYRRWNRDSKGHNVFRQLVLWLTGDESGETTPDTSGDES